MREIPPTGWFCVISGKNPFQAWLMAYLLLSGIGFATTTAPAPQSVVAVLPPWATQAWGVSLVAGAAIVLVGTYWRGVPETGARVEMLGCFIFAAANPVYPIALIARVFTAPADQAALVRGSWLIIGLVLVLSLSAVARIAQLRNSIAEVHRIRAMFSEDSRS